MKQILIGGGQGTLDTSTSYGPISGAPLWANTGVGHELSGLATESCTLSNFRMKLTTAPGSGKSRTFTVYKNNASTDLEIVISDTETEGSDTINTVSLVAGDRVCLRHVPSNSPTSSTTEFYSMELDTETNNTSIIMGSSTNLNSSSTRYLTLFSKRSSATTGQAYATCYFPCAGTLKNFYVETYGSPGTSKTYTFTIYRNNGSTSLEVAITGPASTGNNTSDTVSISKGDYIHIRCDPSSYPAATTCTWGITFEADNDGEIPVCAAYSSDYPRNDATEYNYLVPSTGYVDTFQFTSTESYRYQYGLNAIIKNLWVYFNNSPGAGKYYRISLYNNEVEELHVLLEDSDDQGEDTNSFQVTTWDDNLYYKIVPYGTPTSYTYPKISFIQYDADAVTGPNALATERYIRTGIY